MLTSKDKVIIYAQDSFSGAHAKTAVGVLKYAPYEVVAVVDKSLVGKNTKEIYPFLEPVPIVESIEKAKELNPNANVLLIGIAPPGGALPNSWNNDLKLALHLNLNIVNGLHDYLSAKNDILDLANEKKLYLWDVRKCIKNYPVGSAKLLDYQNKIVLTVGTDAAIGKKTTAIELKNQAIKNGINAAFVATGQTGMMISGNGVAIDAVISDFASGAIETEIINEIKKRNGDEMIFVEGQGSLLHPGWSGVTLSLLHGSLPHYMILCHKLGRDFLKDTKVNIPSIKDVITIYENIALPLRKAKVVGISLNTMGFPLKEAMDKIYELEDELNLPVCDPIIGNSDKLLKACKV